MKVLSITILLLCSFTIAIAQTGPGGVGNATTNGLWLKADQLTLANNDPVATWIDRSGNNNDAIAVATEQPVYISSSAMNNMPVVQFDGINDIMTIADDPMLDGGNGLTFFAVIRPSNLDNSPRPILGKRDYYGSPNYSYCWFFNTGNYLNLDITRSNNRFDTSPIGFSNATNYIFSFDFDGSLPANERSKIFSDGDLVKTAGESSTSVLNSTSDLLLSAFNPGDNRQFGADYAEIIQYNTSLNLAQAIIVNNYLSAKYAIPLAANDIYNEDDSANNDYDYEVAGIGQVDGSNNHTEAQGSGIVRILSPNDLGDDEFLIWGHNNGDISSAGVTDLPPTIEARLQRDWSASEVGEVGNITIRFDLSDISSSIITSDLRLLIDADGVYNSGATISGPPTSLGSGIYEWTGININDNDHFTIGSINKLQTPLPVKLIEFTATVMNNNHVQLVWQTASESNNDYFTIERSKDGLSWQTLGRVTGAGNSSTLKNFNYIDERPLLGTSYYRLKQTDYDGQSDFSEIKSVLIKNSEHVTLKLYPNPTNHKITVTCSNSNELETILFYNAIGQNITHLINPVMVNSNQVDIDISSLPLGLYFVKTRNTTKRVYKY